MATKKEETAEYIKNIERAAQEVANWSKDKLENAKQAFSEQMPSKLKVKTNADFKNSATFQKDLAFMKAQENNKEYAEDKIAALKFCRIRFVIYYFSSSTPGWSWALERKDEGTREGGSASLENTIRDLWSAAKIEYPDAECFK
jgi:hypothetical protein